MSIYHHDDLDDFVTQRQSDEAYPWGDRAPFDWDEDDIDIDQLWAEDVIEELLNDCFGPDSI